MKLRLSFLIFLLLLVSSPDVSAKNAHEALLQAENDLDQGRFKDAEDKLDDVDGAVWEFWRAALMARAKLGQNEPKEALELLENLPTPPKNLINKNQRFYRSLYKEALETGLAAAERLSKSREVWERGLWAYFPDYEGRAATAMPSGVRAEDKAARLHILFEKSNFDPIPSLVSSGEIAGADLPREDKCRALFEWAYAHQKLKRKDEALSGYERVERSSCDGIILARALYWKGTLEENLRQYAAAEETFKSLAKRSSASGGAGRYKDDAYYRLYRIYQATNQDDKAEKALSELTSLPQGDMKEKHLWEEGFGAFRRGEYKTALGLFEKIIATHSLGTEAQPQALYWKGRAEEILSKKKRGGGSAATYRRILKSYPFSFYAVLAESRLGESASVPFVTKAKAGFPSDKDLAEGFRMVDHLNRKDETRSAADLMDYLTNLRPVAAKEKPDAVAQRWMDVGDFNRALEIATEHLDKSAFDINLPNSPLTRAMYPFAYPDHVKKAAEVNRLPLALILGIMREESLFVRDVRSHAGAVGVMQIMPATGRLKARALGIPHSYGDLSDPSSNIVLGSSYLREMLNRFDDKTPLAVMAYNAGPGNVAKWLRNQGDLPLDEFIESTPLTETRGYVKRVLRSARIYGHLLGISKRLKLFASLEPPQN